MPTRSTSAPGHVDAATTCAACSEVRELMRPTPLPIDPPAWGLCDGNHAEDHEFIRA